MSGRVGGRQKNPTQRSCANQPKVGALVAVRKHLPWVDVQNENNLNEVVAARRLETDWPQPRCG